MQKTSTIKRIFVCLQYGYILIFQNKLSILQIARCDCMIKIFFNLKLFLCFFLGATSLFTLLFEGIVWVCNDL
eukprot:UN31940